MATVVEPWKVGDEVCCCDCEHRTIAAICEETNDLEMTDGGVYDAKQCVEPVQSDGFCHTGYANLRD